MKILVIGPSWVGDMVMSQSLYRTLKARHPDAIIDVMAPSWCRPLLDCMPEVDEAIAMPLGHGKLELGVRRKLGLSLKSRHYDQAIVLPGSLKSALVPWFAGIPKRTGWRGEMRYGLLNDIRMLDAQAFPLMVQRYVALAFDKLAMTSSQAIPEPLLKPRLVVDPANVRQTLQSFSLNMALPTLALCPGAEFGPAKCWPDYHYVKVAESMIAQGWQVFLFGSDNDRPVGDAIVGAIAPLHRDGCVNLAGKTSLGQAVEILSQCSAAISNDSGLMHVAAAVGLPLVALYGPSSPDFTPPLSDQAKVLRLITGYLKIRKGDSEQGYHQSLIDISPEMSIEALQDVLGSKQTSQHEIVV
ncbi:ADP-heptose--LPS heptosyltransferase RfaF [Kistimonas scapharcae]|uniref:lipopolysaccharide heptosyltransferase II n=1 Tax=Kistimonas scapharcae TaxID=1036133 RepID=A0ABP8V8T3_9GAMM